MFKRVIFTNGCFDVLHRGHLELLRYCRSLGGTVIVGLNCDDSVKRLKGDSRPINNQNDRKLMLESLKFVDKVIVFSEDTPYNLIKEISPDIIVKGGDYKPEDVVGKDVCEVKIFNYVAGYSTTKTIQGITSR
jgi:D-beta-D-heptose 7-phosphate kinase/D-beta-D-heptose 1-phosphate adenosyltransferase